jgi:hypothetical protein
MIAVMQRSLLFPMTLNRATAASGRIVAAFYRQPEAALLSNRPNRMNQLKWRKFHGAMLRKKMCDDQQYHAEHSSEKGTRELVEAATHQ